MLPTDSHVANATTTVFPTHPISSKEYPVGMVADQDGHIVGSLPVYGMVIPPSAVGANKIYFDLFNAQASTIVRLEKIFAVPATDVAVTGVVSVRLDVMRTSTIGTGGTAAVGASASKTAATIYPLNTANTLPAGITARYLSTGGATDAQWLFPAYVSTEETNVSAHIAQFYNILPELSQGSTVELAVNQGLKIVQGTVASVGSIGFYVVFTVE